MGSKYASEIAVLKNVTKLKGKKPQWSPPSVKFQVKMQALQPRIFFLHLIATSLTGRNVVGKVGGLPVKRLQVLIKSELAQNRVANQLKKVSRFAELSVFAGTSQVLYYVVVNK